MIAFVVRASHGLHGLPSNVQCLHHKLRTLYFCDPVQTIVCHFVIDMKLEQRANMKFCFKHGTLARGTGHTFENIRR